MRKEDNTTWDVAVIGGGPAGMMAAGRAAEFGARVVLIEKNAHLGQKLLLTGGGRCNLTNEQPDARAFLKKFGDSAKFLFSPFSQFGVVDTIKFFNERGIETKVEEGGRVFPVSDNAATILDAMKEYLKKGKVTVFLDSPVREFVLNKEKIEKVRLVNGRDIVAKNYIVATGGLSHPETGSTGDGFRWLEKLGHKIVKPDAALVPVKTKETWVHDLQGISLSEIKLTLFSYDKKIVSKKGKILFTHFGLSGPLVLNMSKTIRGSLDDGSALLELDIFPSDDQGMLDKKIRELFDLNRNKKVKNVLTELVPAALVNVLGEISALDLDKEIHDFSRESRLLLVKLLKHLSITVSGLLGAEHSIVTSGGAMLEEIDTKTMRSKIVPDLFLVGDMLDVDRPSGGFSLQLCWTTGYVAGTSASQNI